MCFLWQYEIYLWYLPGTACLYSEPSPVDLAYLQNHLLHACRYWCCGCHPQDTAEERDITYYSFSSIRAVVYGFSGNMRNKLVGLRRIILACSFVFFMRLAYQAFFTRTRIYDTYILVVRLKQNNDAVRSLVLLWVTGVRADPKFSYSYDIICMYVRIVTFDFSLKYFVFFVSTRYLVVGSRYDFFFRFQHAAQHMPVGFCSIPSDNVKTAVCGLSRSGWCCR